MKQAVISLTLLLCATLSFAQELKVKSFIHNDMNLEARVGGGRKDLNGKQCALIKVLVRDNIMKCKGGNIGDIITEGVVKKIFVSPSTKFLELEFQYNFPLKITFSDYGIKNLAEGCTYTITLVDAYTLSQHSSQQDNIHAVVSDVQTQSEHPSQPIVHPEPNPDAIPITVNGVTFNMIKVDGGTFTMGGTYEQGNTYGDEKPTHQVTLSTYYIGETEVTQELWTAVMGKNSSWHKGDILPVEQVSWKDCVKFIERLKKLTNRIFRLPTEAEWEFAARGGNKSNCTMYSGSDDIDEVAWYGENRIQNTNPVKTKKANELGIYDMSGNVSEWCNDWKGAYGSDVQVNPIGPKSGNKRVCRGGGTNCSSWSCRSSYRDEYAPGYKNNYLGFRLALSE